MKSITAARALCLLAFFCAINIFYTSPAFGQPGTLDATFNTADIGTNVAEGANKDVRAIAVQADGKIIIGGNFTSYQGITVNRIARLNTNGTLDPTFTIGTGVDSTVNRILIQPDGKIIIGGYFNNFNSASAPFLVRLNTNGTRDAAFVTGTGPNNIINSIARQTDGKIIIGGRFTTYNGITSNYLVRLLATGARDATFAPSVANSVNELALQTDGKVLIGINNDGNGLVTNFLRRLNTTGTNDATFNVGQPGANGTVSVVKVQADGKILIGGDFTGFNDFSGNFTRINSNGSLDAAFENIPDIFPGGLKTLALQTDGKILAGYGEQFVDLGDGEQFGSRVKRLNSDGTIDAGFNHEFYEELTDNVYAILVQADGKILVAESPISRWFGGSVNRYRNHAANLVTPGMRDFKINRFNTDGSRDQTFGIAINQTGPNRQVNAVAIQPDGKTLIGGSLFSYNGVSSNYLLRLNANGTKDIAFNSGGVGFNKKVNGITVQPDGKILVVGAFTEYNGGPATYLIRLNPDGSRDLGFVYNATSFTYELNTIVVQPDGKLLVGGSDQMFRLNSNGSLDASYNTVVYGAFGTFFPFVGALALQSNGKILIGGEFDNINGGGGLRKINLARVNPDGSRDLSFSSDGFRVAGNPGTDNFVQAIKIQPNGAILVAGGFDRFINRITYSGQTDASFNPGGLGANGKINSILLQSDGKIIIAGDFTSYNGTAKNRIARLNADGTLDLTFSPGGVGANSEIKSLAFDGQKILVGGNFTNYNGSNRNRIIRLSNCDGTRRSETNVAVCTLPYTWNGNSYAAAGTYTRTLTTAGGCDSVAVLNLSLSASAISGPVKACPYLRPGGLTATYSVVAPAGSTFTWSVNRPLTTFIVSGAGTNQIGVQFGSDFVSGNVSVRVINTSCGINTTRSLTVTRTVPSTPAAIVSSSSNICSALAEGTAITYTTRKANGATSYNWTAQAGTTVIYHPNGPGVNDTVVQIRFDNAFTTSPVSVQSVNDCGVTSTRSLTVSRALPSTPGAISGPTDVCPFMQPDATSLAVYTVPPVAGMLYTWTLTLASPAPGSSFILDDTDNSVSTDFRDDFTTGSISVTATNGCGTSTARTLSLRKLTVSTPGAITVTATGSCPDRTYTYSIATPARSTVVNWDVPAGATIISGQGTPSIAVSYPPTAITGYVSVQAFNNCSSSSIRRISINLTACPPSPFAKVGVPVETITEENMQVKVYPNPSSAEFNLQFNSSLTDKATVRILDIQGRPLQSLSTSPGRLLRIGDKLFAGTYFVEVTQGKFVRREKIIKL